MAENLSAIILAAGEGSRMRSSTPKPLHRLCGRPMVLHVIDALCELHVDRIIVVVGHGADEVIGTVSELAPPGASIEFVTQKVQQGTGDATAVALAVLDHAPGDDDVIVLPGDTPLLRPSTMVELVDRHRQGDSAATLLTARLEDPSGYGRVVRAKDGRVEGVIEHADATDQQRSIDEINTSIYCFRRSLLSPALRRLSPSNAQGEYYLTDAVGVLFDAGHRTDSLTVEDASEVAGVNDRSQLADAEAVLRARINLAWLKAGVTMVDPRSTYIDTSVELGADVTLLPGVVLRGETTVGERCTLGPNALIEDSQIAAGARIAMASIISASVGEDAHVGSFVALEKGASVPAAGVVEAHGGQAL